MNDTVGECAVNCDLHLCRTVNSVNESPCRGSFHPRFPLHRPKAVARQLVSEAGIYLDVFETP